MITDLHIKYRPKTLSEVVGHDSIVRSLETVVEDIESCPHAFLFTGGSGMGKTTLARIIGSVLDAQVMEIDGATSTGIDAMRELKQGLTYYGFGKTIHKLVIVDECHMLSKSAWNSLLSVLEQPPSHVYFALCTTDAKKVPPAVVTRCHRYDLKPVRMSDIRGLLDYVCLEEDITLDSKSLSKIARESGGSPRQALVYLSMCRSCEAPDEVDVLISTSASKDQNAIDLCRLLCNPKNANASWEKYLTVLNNLRDNAEDPASSAEGLRLTVLNYATKVLLGSKNEDDACLLFNVIQAFSVPYNPAEKFAPVLLSVGECYFSNV